MKACMFLLSWSLFFFIQKGSAQSVNKTIQEANEQSRAVQSLPETKEKADTLIALSQWYYDHLASDTTFTDKAYTLATNAQRLATKLKYNRGLFNAYMLLSSTNRAKGNFKQGISDAESALRYANALKDENAIGDAWTALWGSNTDNGMPYKDQIQILLKAELAFINSGDKKRQADCDFRLADIYLYLRDYINTRIKLNLALKLYRSVI